MAKRPLQRRKGRLSIWLGFLASVEVLAAHVSLMWSPAHWAVPALAGLAFPVFGAVLLGATVGAFRRRRMVWAAGFVLLVVISAPLYRHVWGGFGWGLPQAEVDAPSLTTMSWNVRLYDRYGWLGEGTREGIFKAVEAEGPDLLCLQEHFRDPDPRSFPVEGPMRSAMTAQGKGEVGLHEVWAKGKAGRRFGVATWSRHPIVGRESISFGTSSNNVCAVTDIVWQDDTVRVFNAHFASLRFGSAEYAALEEGLPDADGRQRIWSRMQEAYKARVAQVELVMEAVSKSPHPVLLCGDFNDVPISWALEKVRLQLRDAHDVRGLRMDGTWQGAIPGVRIDHIFVDLDMPVLSYRTGGKERSDHGYVLSQIQLPSLAAGI